MGIDSLPIQSQIKRGKKNGFRNMAASQCYFYGDIGRSVSKTC